MLTYQVRRRQIKILGTSTVSFPADVEINFHLLPKQAFGVSLDGGRTLTQGVAGGLLFNLNTGQHSARSDQPLGALAVREPQENGAFEIRGNVVTRQITCPDVETLTRTIQEVYFLLPSLLSVRFADPPHVDRVDGKLAGHFFTWELADFLAASQITSKAEQERRMATAWLEMPLVLDPQRRRLLAALTYFHTGCRLLREAKTPGEFLAEALLNFAKVLETLWSGTPDKTREAVKAGLVALGTSPEVIERELMPVLLLRSQFDVAHVSLAVLTVEQGTTLQRHAERVESVLATLLNDLLERVRAGTWDVRPYEDRGLDPSYANTIARLKEHLDAIGP